MDAAQAAVSDLEAVEAGNRAVQEVCARGMIERPCGTSCGERSWTLASSQQSRYEHRVSHCLLRLDRTPDGC